jgi:hypothetical protein
VTASAAAEKNANAGLTAIADAIKNKIPIKTIKKTIPPKGGMVFCYALYKLSL